MSIFNPISDLRSKLKNNEVCLGMFHVSANSLISEALSVSNIDWLAYDMEASPANKRGLLHFLQSMKASQVAAFVRAESKIETHLEQLADLGVNGIIVPKVSSQEEAKNIVRALKYPPFGNRGVNPVRASSYLKNVAPYFSSANDNIFIFAQIESKTAVENVDSILKTEGIDGVFVGCGDLAMDLGVPGKMDSDILLSAIDKVLRSCLSNGKIPGIFAYNTQLAQQFLTAGFKMVAFGNDIAFLLNSVNQEHGRLVSFVERN